MISYAMIGPFCLNWGTQNANPLIYPKRAGEYDAAVQSARDAATIQETLNMSNFTLDGVPGSDLYKMLIPLGYQFEAEMLRTVRDTTEAAASLTEPLTVDDEVLSYRRCMDTPPLNISREFH